MKISTKIFLILFFISALHLTLYISPSYAAVPHLINYQGRLTDSGGKPLDGLYNLTFRIYDSENAGTLLWEETHSSLIIQKGIFGVLLGSVTNLNLAFDKPYFLEIKVGNEVMSPRQQITSAGYAIRAENVEIAEKIKADSSDPTAGYLSEKVDNSTIEVNAAHKLQIKDGSLTAAKIAPSVVGDIAEANALSEKTMSGTSYIKVKEIGIGRNGNIRVKFQLKGNNPQNVFYAQIYKNGTPIGTERSTQSISYIEYSEDINNVKTGDLIQLYCKNNGATTFVRNFRVCVGNPLTSSVNMD